MFRSLATVLALLLLAPVALADDPTPTGPCRNVPYSDLGLFTLTYQFEIVDRTIDDRSSTIVPLDDAHDVETITATIARRHGIPRESVILRKAHINTASHFFGAPTSDGEAVCVDACHHGAGGIQTRVASGVTPPGGGTVLAPMQANEREIVLVWRMELVETSTSHPEMKLLDMKEDRELRRAVEDLDGKIVDDPTFPAVDRMRIQGCG